jgi:hypothetical protein
VKHDALFKMLLKRPAIFKGLFDAFLPEAGKFVDFKHLEFVDKERIALDGSKLTGDLQARRLLEYFLLDWQGLFATMTFEQVEYVCETLKKVTG